MPLVAWNGPVNQRGGRRRLTENVGASFCIGRKPRFERSFQPCRFHNSITASEPPTVRGSPPHQPPDQNTRTPLTTGSWRESGTSVAGDANDRCTLIDARWSMHV
jgi:hypothetical protein